MSERLRKHGRFRRLAHRRPVGAPPGTLVLPAAEAVPTTIRAITYGPGARPGSFRASSFQTGRLAVQVLHRVEPGLGLAPVPSSAGRDGQHDSRAEELRSATRKDVEADEGNAGEAGADGQPAHHRRPEGGDRAPVEAGGPGRGRKGYRGF